MQWFELFWNWVKLCVYVHIGKYTVSHLVHILWFPSPCTKLHIKRHLLGHTCIKTFKLVLNTLCEKVYSGDKEWLKGQSSQSTGHGIRVLVLDFTQWLIIFFTDTQKALNIQCYTHVGVHDKNKSIVYHPTQELTNLWLIIIPQMVRSCYHCCCIHEPVIFSHCVHLKLGHRFHALLKVCSDRDDIVPWTVNMSKS